MIIVLILERVPPSLRGDITRWLAEPRAGVFVGRVSAEVRDRLWDRVTARSAAGGCLLIHEDPRREQGVRFRQHGDLSRTFLEADGLTLVCHPREPERDGTDGGTARS